MLDIERKFFERNQAKWQESWPGQFVLIRGGSLVGHYTSIQAAVSKGAREFGMTPFLVRHVAEQPLELQDPTWKWVQASETENSED